MDNAAANALSPQPLAPIAPGIEVVAPPTVEESAPETQARLSTLARRAVLAAAFALPVAQMGLEDPIFAALYGKLSEGGLLRGSTAGIAALLAAENAALCLAIKKLPLFEKAQAATEAETDPSPNRVVRVVKRLGSFAACAAKYPFVKAGELSESLGNGIEQGGEWIDGELENTRLRAVGKYAAKAARATGGLFIDTGKVNLVGTAPLMMHRLNSDAYAGLDETARNRAINWDIGKYTALFTGSWFGLVSLVRPAYEASAHIPHAQEVLDASWAAFNYMTSANVPSVTAMVAAGGFLAYKGHQALRASERAEQAAAEA
jgi:hypothetical protein